MLENITDEYNLDQLVVYFIDNVLSGEASKLTLDILKTFSRYDYTNYESDIHNLISISDIIDRDNYNYMIYDLLTEHLKAVLKYIGVIIDDDIEVTSVNLTMLNKILVTLDNLPKLDKDEAEDVITILNMDDVKIKCFNTVLNKYGDINELYLENTVIDVTNTLINNLTNICKNIIKHTETTEFVDAVFNIINKLLKIESGYIPLAANILTTNPDVDRTLSLLIKNYLDDISKRDSKSSGIDIASLVLVSDECCVDTDKIYAEYFEQLIDNKDTYLSYKKAIDTYLNLKE